MKQPEVSRSNHGGVEFATDVALQDPIPRARAEADQNLLAEVIEVVDYLEVSRPIWELAGKTSARLRSHGIKAPISDLVIGALAIEHNCHVLTADSHFDYMPELKRFPWRKVTPSR